MSGASNDDAKQSVLARLAQLESELRVMRRALAEEQRGDSVLPTSDLQVLRCRLDADVYAVLIDDVVEIVRYVRVTRVADLPSSVVGAINVRGNLVAVVDVRRRLNHTPQAPRRGTAIVLVQIEQRVVGLIVDEVLDVVVIPHQSLRAPTGALAGAQAIAAIATVEPDVVQLIELRRLLSVSEWTRLAHAIEPALEEPLEIRLEADGGPDERG